MKVIRRILVLIALLFLTAEGVFIWHTSQKAPQSHTTPSVTTFAYDEMRAGHIVSNIDSAHPISITKHNSLSKLTEDALKYQPLLIRDPRSGDDGHRSRSVLIFPTRTGLRAVDVDLAELIWDVDSFKGRIQSTPVIDLKRRWIYFYTNQWLKNDGNKSTWLYHVYQIDLEGKNLRGFTVDIGEIAERMYPEPLHDEWGRRVHCKTAMGLNQKVFPSYVFFGCSIATGGGRGKYGSLRGLSGQLLAFSLDSRGRLLGPRHLKIFYTSNTNSSSVSGYDTGIYHLGSAPAVLPDGSLLVATGNGPVLLGQHNFGCSIVRLDGSTLQPKVGSNGRIMAFSHSVPPYSECWETNTEFTSSSVAVVEHDGALVASVTSKDGQLHVFDPGQMDPSRSRVTKHDIGQWPTYGQPVLLKGADRVRAFAVAGNRERDHSVQDVTLVNEELLHSLDHVAEVECFGWLSKSKTSGTSALALLYSGPLHDDYAVAVEGSALYSGLISYFDDRLGHRGNQYVRQGLKTPYVLVAYLGYGIPERGPFGTAPYRPEILRDLETYFQSKHDKPGEFDRGGLRILRSFNGGRDCTREEFASVAPIYKVTRAHTRLRGGRSRIVAYDIDKSGVPREVWVHEIDNGEMPLRTHPVVTSGHDKQKSVVIVLTSERVLDADVSSTLRLIAGDSGIELGREQFTGGSHFSMPLVFDDKVVIATKKDGLKVFTVSPSKTIFDYWNSSLLNSFLKFVTSH